MSNTKWMIITHCLGLAGLTIGSFAGDRVAICGLAGFGLIWFFLALRERKYFNLACEVVTALENDRGLED